jgi:hypothetical protein
MTMSLTLDPLATSELLTQTHRRYLRSLLPIREPAIADALARAVAESPVLSKPPLLEATPPYETRTNLEASLDGFNRFGGWQGTTAIAFMDYTPRLIAAITTLETSCETTADAIAAYRSGLMEIWSTVITETSSAVAKTIGAPGEKDKDKKAKQVVNIINAWVSWAGNLWAAYIKLDEANYKALDKIGQALAAPAGLVNVKGRNDTHYDGPSGFQLPMPTDVSLTPDWRPDEVRQRWQLKPGASVEVQMEPFKKLIQGLRDNGDFWNAAYKKQIEAWLAMPPKAFSVIGGSFYESLSKVLARDYITYLYSDPAHGTSGQPDGHGAQRVRPDRRTRQHTLPRLHRQRVAGDTSRVTRDA